MANNQYVNKVEYAGQTVIDITGDTVTPSDVLSGVTFHDRSGAPQTGGLITHNVYDGLDSSSATDALSANQGKVLNDTINYYHQSETVTDCNTYRKGIGRIIDSTANRPFNYGILNTYVHSSTGYITQIAVSVANPTKIACRNSGDGGTTWVAWYVVNDQIDTLNDKIATAHNFGQYTSLDTFKSDLLSFMQNTPGFEPRCIQFVFTQTVAPFTAWSTFTGYAHCIQNGATSLYFECNVASNDGKNIIVGYSNGTWYINELALNSNMTTSQENLETGLDITRNGKIRTLRIGKTITNSIIAMLSANDRPKMSVNAVMRYKNTSDTYYTALVTVGDDGVISASYFSGATIATVSNGTITGTITYIV